MFAVLAISRVSLNSAAFTCEKQAADCLVSEAELMNVFYTLYGATGILSRHMQGNSAARARLDIRSKMR